MIKIKTELPQKAWIGFLLFSSIFAFKLPIIGNSSYWSFALIIASLFLFNGSYSNLRILTKQTFFYYPIIILLACALFAFLIPVFYQTYDISMVKTWINNILGYIAMTILACLFYTQFKKVSDVFKLLIIVFMIQVVIVWAMLAHPGLREAIQGITKSSAALARLETYGGSRGLGLTSFVAFSFSVIMGLLGYFMHYYFAVFGKERSLTFKVVCFYLAFIAGISAGRTSIAGFALGFVFYWLANTPSQFIRSTLKSLIISLLLVTPIAIYIATNPALAEIVDKYYRYAFQFIYKYFTEGYLGRSSLDSLETMYFPLTEKQILMGDGKYAGFTGGYYMETDAGFMRYILLFGLLPSLFIYLSFLFMMFVFYWVNKNTIPHLKTFTIGIVAIAFVFHYKGEIILFNVSFMKLIYFTFITATLFSLHDKTTAQTAQSGWFKQTANN